MAKPHEETWEADGAGVYEAQSQDIVGGGNDDHRHTDASAARALLAAQAPAMARMLLEGEWICEERGDLCRHCMRLTREGHTDWCALATVLRAAGVLP